MTFRLCLVHPCIGRHIGMTSYIRTWCMEPLQPATLAALCPDDVEIFFYDDRLEKIPTDMSFDLVAMSIETYTAQRAYQIASDFRRNGVPVVMGGFHASLCPDEVAHYAESIVIGEAEELFPQVIDDYKHGTAQARYHSTDRPSLQGVLPDRRIFIGKNYLPVTLIESVRGCRHRCDFCAIQTVFNGSASRRPVDLVIQEIKSLPKKPRLIFFVDDNIITDREGSRAFLRELASLRVRWVSQASSDVAYDDETLTLMRQSGCQGVLVGFESLNPDNLTQMNKRFNMARGGPKEVMQRFTAHGIRVYGTFVFGYDYDNAETVQESVSFAIESGMFIAAFNHLTPFPGTPLYKRLEEDNRLVYPSWWFNSDYHYNDVPFYPRSMSGTELTQYCLQARRDFYSWSSIARRATHRIHWRDLRMFTNYLIINAMHRSDVDGRNGLPLGDASWTHELLPVG